MGCLKLTYHHEKTNASNLRVAYKSDSLNRRNPETKNSQKLRSDHLVFGWDMPGRSFTAQAYKFGYQGSEREKEYMGGAVPCQGEGKGNKGTNEQQNITEDLTGKNVEQQKPN